MRMEPITLILVRRFIFSLLLQKTSPALRGSKGGFVLRRKAQFRREHNPAVANFSSLQRGNIAVKMKNRLYVTSAPAT